MKMYLILLVSTVVLTLEFSSCTTSPNSANENVTDTIYVVRASDTGLVYIYPEQRDIVLLTLKTTLVQTDSVKAQYKIEGTVLNNRDSTLSFYAIRVMHYNSDSILVYSCPMVMSEFELGFILPKVRSKRKGYFSTDVFTAYGKPTGSSVYSGSNYTSKYLDIKIADTAKMSRRYTEIEFFKF